MEFEEDDEFSLKWIDEEGDPIMMTSDMEFEEAKRLFYKNNCDYLVINVFEVGFLLYYSHPTSVIRRF